MAHTYTNHTDDLPASTNDGSHGGTRAMQEKSVDIRWLGDYVTFMVFE